MFPRDSRESRDFFRDSRDSSSERTLFVMIPFSSPDMWPMFDLLSGFGALGPLGQPQKGTGKKWPKMSKKRQNGYQKVTETEKSDLSPFASPLWLRSRPSKPNQRKGQKGKFMNSAHSFVNSGVFPWETRTIHISHFCSGMPLWKVHEPTSLWFGLPGPLLIGGTVNFTLSSLISVCVSLLFLRLGVEVTGLSGPNRCDATAMCDAIRIAHPQIASDAKKLFR